MRVRVSVDISEAKRKLDDVRVRLAAPRPALKHAAAELDGLIQKRVFRAETSPDGVRWRPLKLSARKRRERKILVKTGLLRKSISITAKSDYIDVGVDGSALKYAVVHQFGSRNGVIPRRAFLPIDPKGNPDFRTGWPRKWMVATGKRIERYVLTGRKG